MNNIKNNIQNNNDPLGKNRQMENKVNFDEVFFWKIKISERTIYLLLFKNDQE